MKIFRQPVTNLFFAMAITIFFVSCNGQAKKKNEWITLFNGKDLTGWTPKITGYDAGVNFGNTFRVENGILKVSYDQYGGEFKGRYGHLFYNKPFSNYLIHVEYRFVGEQCPGGAGWAFRNSGIMLHGQTPQSMAKDQSYPVSVEFQLLGGDGTNPRPTGNVCTPGTNIVMKGELVTRHCTDSDSKTYHGDQWVTAEAEVHGNGIIKHIINGDTVLVYSKPQLDPTDSTAMPLIKNGNLMLSSGTISLQSESHPVEFRKVAIKLLDN